jgi:predicted DNA-binding transcriptional regulator YafY
LWKRSAINEEGKELATRTFANHIASIADIFGIDIVCDRKTNRYYIENIDDVGGKSIREWMLDALCLNSLLNESATLRDRVIFENVPSSRRFLADIIQAIRDNYKIEIRYKSYRKTEEETFIIEPYFLKEFKRRWYLYGYKGDVDGPHMMALDRMIDVDIIPEEFTMPEEFMADDYFRGIYGARVYPNMKREMVKLKVYGTQVQYFRSLPLHSSQKEVEKNDKYSVFTYFITPDYDFKQDVLSFGDKVEVLEPKELREEMRGIVKKLNKIYSK